MLQFIGQGSKNLFASVSQDDISALQSKHEMRVTVDMTRLGLTTFDSVVRDISPAASNELSHFSLNAPFGGPLDVKSPSIRSENMVLESFESRF